MAPAVPAPISKSSSTAKRTARGRPLRPPGAVLPRRRGGPEGAAAERGGDRASGGPDVAGGREVEVGRRPAAQEVAHATADEVGLRRGGVGGGEHAAQPGGG